MRFLFGAALIAAVCLLATGQLVDPDAHRSFSEFIAVRNFSLQTHEVTTSDGYVIVIHRVVPKYTYNSTIYSRQRKPVIAFHGLMCQSSIFYINTPCVSPTAPDCKDNFGLRMALDDSKYDLWVPNARGNGVSMGHTNTNLNSGDLIGPYWKFSWEEMGKYDLPAVIDYVLAQTGHKSVGYIGYSQGGGSALAMATMKPTYANKLKPFIGWAPAAYLQGAPSITNLPVQALQLPLSLVPGKFVVTDEYFNTLATTFCPDLILDLPAGLCSGALEAVVGATNSINMTRVPVIFNFFPALVSNWQMVHYGQQFSTGKFAHYDFGLAGNLIAYNKPIAPDFDLSKIPDDLKIFIFNGASDALVTPSNTLKLINNLKAAGITTVEGNVVGNPDAANPTDASKAKWNHLDFLTGLGAGALVYDKTIDYLNKNIVWDGPPRL